MKFKILTFSQDAASGGEFSGWSAATPKARHTLFAISLWLFCNPWWFESNLDDPEKLPSIVAALVFHIFVLALALVIIHKNVKDGNPDLDATRYLTVASSFLRATNLRHMYSWLFGVALALAVAIWIILLMVAYRARHISGPFFKAYGLRAIWHLSVGFSLMAGWSALSALGIDESHSSKSINNTSNGLSDNNSAVLAVLGAFLLTITQIFKTNLDMTRFTSGWNFWARVCGTERREADFVWLSIVAAIFAFLSLIGRLSWPRTIAPFVLIAGIILHFVISSDLPFLATSSLAYVLISVWYSGY